MHAIFEKLIRGYTETATPQYSEGMQELHGDGQFSKYFLSRTTEMIKTNIWFNQEK